MIWMMKRLWCKHNEWTMTRFSTSTTRKYVCTKCNKVKWFKTTLQPKS